MRPSLALSFAISIYDRVWPLVIPMLRRHRRLSDGFGQRMADSLPRTAEVWIQAASAGEAYLALELVESLASGGNTSILLTTNTRQGLEILETAVKDGLGSKQGCGVQTRYFPFDRPAIMKRVVKTVNPQVMVMLETEIWPAHLLALKQSGSRILLINGRLTPRSLKRYLIWPGIWRQLSPDLILAVSAPDAKRFEKLFPAAPIATMPNMKFDRMAPSESRESTGSQPPRTPTDCPFVVLGSVRQQEEEVIGPMMASLNARLPRAIIGLFPRHMDRIGYWQKWLQRSGLQWELRSKLNRAAKPGAIILWDRFGELASAYQQADAAFVGGSLEPLGGQNFLEPLVSGVVTVIGPYWENFHWVGPEILSKGLLKVAQDGQSAAELLARAVADSRPKSEIRAAACEYIDARRGGTRQAADQILKNLKEVAR